MPASRLILAALLLAGAQEKENKPAPTVRLRLSSERRLNPSREMPVRFTIENATEGDLEIDEPADYLDGLEILDGDGKVLKKFGASSAKKRTVKVEKGGFIGRVLDITPAMTEAKAGEGIVKLTWKQGTATSNTIEPFVVRDWVATVETNHGDIRLEFFPEVAPRHVLNFTDIARQGRYDGLTFHRIIPSFMMQGGKFKDPPGFRLKAEFNEYRHDVGTLSMARTGDPDSASTEFFICFARLPALDGKYTVFGQMVAGEPVLRAIEKVPTDHSPCPKCGKELEPRPTPCCGAHHEDRPRVDVVIKKITLIEKGSK
jgi:peptidyl-prolyl cis-trans isomerase B (cyclophilin B)